jgi:DNA (cytosine-5)-methyltransferase 1
MRYLSLFSGMSADHQAWCLPPPGGDPFDSLWECVGFSEVDPAACAVLEHHYPSVPNLGDITKITEEQIWDLGQIDLIMTSSPCQGLSAAGNRKGIGKSADDREDAHEESKLFWDAMRVISWAGACGLRFAAWENVPGAFSSNKGRDFALLAGAFIGARFDVPKNGWKNAGVVHGPGLGFSGPNGAIMEWRVVDALYTGGCDALHRDEFGRGPVPQRRRRIFAVTDFGNWANRKPIFFERESLCWNFEASTKKRQKTPAPTGSNPAGDGGRATPVGICHEHIGALTASGRGVERPGVGYWNDDDAAQTVRKGNKQGNGSARESTLVTAYRTNGLGEVTEQAQSAALTQSSDPCAQVLLQSTDFTCQNCGETVAATWWPMCEWCDHEQVEAVAFKASHFTRGKDGAPASHTPPLSADADKGDQDTLLMAPISFSVKDHGADALTSKTNRSTVEPGRECHTLHSDPPRLATGYAIRRLLPVETLRLQGFPSDYFDGVLLRGKPLSDSAKYKMVGNSIAIPCLRWIKRRLEWCLNPIGEEP